MKLKFKAELKTAPDRGCSFKIDHPMGGMGAADFKTSVDEMAAWLRVNLSAELLKSYIVRAAVAVVANGAPTVDVLAEVTEEDVNSLEVPGGIRAVILGLIPKAAVEAERRWKTSLMAARKDASSGLLRTVGASEIAHQAKLFKSMVESGACRDPLMTLELLTKV